MRACGHVVQFDCFRVNDLCCVLDMPGVLPMLCFVMNHDVCMEFYMIRVRALTLWWVFPSVLMSIVLEEEVCACCVRAACGPCCSV